MFHNPFDVDRAKTIKERFYVLQSTDSGFSGKGRESNRRKGIVQAILEDIQRSRIADGEG